MLAAALPVELLDAVLRHLPRSDAAVAARVCRAWRAAVARVLARRGRAARAAFVADRDALERTRTRREAARSALPSNDERAALDARFLAWVTAVDFMPAVLAAPRLRTFLDAGAAPGNVFDDYEMSGTGLGQLVGDLFFSGHADGHEEEENEDDEEEEGRETVSRDHVPESGPTAAAPNHDVGEDADDGTDHDRTDFTPAAAIAGFADVVAAAGPTAWRTNRYYVGNGGASVAGFLLEYVLSGESNRPWPLMRACSDCVRTMLLVRRPTRSNSADGASVLFSATGASVGDALTVHGTVLLEALSTAAVVVPGPDMDAVVERLLDVTAAVDHAGLVPGGDFLDAVERARRLRRMYAPRDGPPVVPTAGSRRLLNGLLALQMMHQ